MKARLRNVDPSLPLAGVSVVVTRPAAASASMKRRIALLGGTAVGLPGTSVRAVSAQNVARAALRAARDADFAIFVSPNAVRYAYALIPPLRFERATRICAVGEGTARALQRRGIRDVLWPRARQDSEGLLALPELYSPRGRKVAFIGAPQGRDLMPRELQARGARISHAEVYRRSGPRFDVRHFDALTTAAPPLFVQLTSVESIVNLRAALADDLFAKLVEGEAIVSSARIAAAARAAGWRRVHRAASAANEDLLAATVSALAQHRL